MPVKVVGDVKLRQLRQHRNFKSFARLNGELTIIYC